MPIGKKERVVQKVTIFFRLGKKYKNAQKINRVRKYFFSGVRCVIWRRVSPKRNFQKLMYTSDKILRLKREENRLFLTQKWQKMYKK